MENCKKYIALILLVLVCSCKSAIPYKNYKKEAKIKQGYLNGVQFGNDKLKKKYAKKFSKIKHQ
jgi:hypothetical protein